MACTFTWFWFVHFNPKKIKDLSNNTLDKVLVYGNCNAHSHIIIDCRFVQGKVTGKIMWVGDVDVIFLITKSLYNTHKVIKKQTDEKVYKKKRRNGLCKYIVSLHRKIECYFVM